MVRLRVKIDEIDIEGKKNFNSSMVRLRVRFKMELNSEE